MTLNQILRATRDKISFNVVLAHQSVEISEIFLPLRFYVKSVLENLAVMTFSEALNFEFDEFFFFIFCGPT